MPEPVLPEVLYHYTSVDTLLKIVTAPQEEACIWATNIRYLNDIREFDYYRDLLTKHATSFLDSLPEELALTTAAALNDVHSREWPNVFVASFSMDGDSLPQWRSYCPHANGVSIGFRTIALRQTVLTRTASELERLSSFSHGPTAIEYIRSEDLEAIDASIKNAIADYKAFFDLHKVYFDGVSPEQKRRMDGLQFASLLARKCAFVKHPSFASEQEYRLTAPAPFGDHFKHLHFRVSKTTVIPYRKLLFPTWGTLTGTTHPELYLDFYIERVVVGPTPNPELTRRALIQLFRKLKVPVIVESTKSPYRDL